MPDLALYDRIAERFAFQIPPEYRLLRERGWLTYNDPPGQISTTPGDRYLWINEMEWMPLEEIAEFSFDEYCDPHLPNLIPFAFTGASDHWCWQGDHTDARGTRIILATHDSYDGEIYAPNFSTALYRQVLHYAAWEPFEPESDLTEQRTYLRRWSIDLSLIFPAEWCATLATLAERPEQDWTDHWGRKHRSLLPDEEREAIESRDIAWPDMDKPIRWMALNEP